MFVGTTFQSDLMDLFDNYNIKSIIDYEHLTPADKTYFLTRLFKCFDKGIKNLQKDLPNIPGFKIHYQLDNEYSKSELLSVEDTFIKKLAFYTSVSIISCPIVDHKSELVYAHNKRKGGRERINSQTLSSLKSKDLYVFGDVKADKQTYGGELHIEGKAYIIDKKILYGMGFAHKVAQKQVLPIKSRAFTPISDGLYRQKRLYGQSLRNDRYDHQILQSN